MSSSVVLFSNENENRSIARLQKQICSRGFSIRDKYKDFSGMEDVVTDEKALQECKAFFQKIYSEPRVWSQIGNTVSDSYFPLETLCIYNNTRSIKDHIAIIDMSYSLDFVLHMLFNADMVRVRALKNYKDLSYCMMNGLEYPDESMTIAELFDVCEGLEQWVASEFEYVQRTCLSLGDMTNKVLYNLQVKLLNMANNIKYYVMHSFKKTHSADIRSATYSAVLASIAGAPTRHIMVEAPGKEQYQLTIECYGPYEILGRKVTPNGFSWGINS